MATLFFTPSGRLSISSFQTPKTSIMPPGTPPSRHRSFSSTMPLQYVVTSVPPFSTNARIFCSKPARYM